MSEFETLVKKMLAGERTALSRLISRIEERTQELSSGFRLLYPKTGSARVWGVTGPPGSGKSTLVDGLVTRLRKKGSRVAVVAVDPSSPFSGGAILGDRVRMQKHAGDDGVFIRSLGTKGRHGGLSHSTKEVVMALDAAGFDTIVVETAGVGQTELEILTVAQTILVLLVPESGDSIQVMKAGIMEIADIFCVNKADRPESDQMVRELTQMVSSLPHDENSWMIPVLKSEAVREKGLDEVLGALEKHFEYMKKHGILEQKWAAMVKSEVVDILTEKLRQDLWTKMESKAHQASLKKLICRKIDPYALAIEISK